MKKILILLSILFLTIACQKAENLLGIDPSLPDGTGAGNLPKVNAIAPAAGGQLTDQNSTLAGIQGRIEVIFSDFMDETTLIPANIEILNTKTNAPLVTNLTTEYFPEIKKLFIYLDTVPSASAYLLRLKDMTNLYGVRLDFDGDNNDDTSPYDDYLSTFYTSGNTDTLVALGWPTLGTLDPYLERVTNQQPVITVNFQNTGAYGMDPATLIPGNFSLVSTSGTNYALDTIAVSGSQVLLQPTGNLPYGDNYRLTITCSNIKMLAKSTTPDYIVVLDGNDNGPQATEPDTGGYFRVDTLVPPQVTVSSITNGAKFTFTEKIDETTINFTNLKVFDSEGFVPGDLRIYSNPSQTYTMVDYYFKRSVSGAKTAFISKAVMDEKGYYFDGDGNEIGGEPWDDLYTSF
jgi:hypothetical protein